MLDAKTPVAGVAGDPDRKRRSGALLGANHPVAHFAPPHVGAITVPSPSANPVDVMEAIPMSAFTPSAGLYPRFRSKIDAWLAGVTLLGIAAAVLLFVIWKTFVP